MSLRYTIWLAWLLLVAPPQVVEGGQTVASGGALPLRSVDTLTVSADRPYAYDFTADAAGLLTVAVRSEDSDLWITVTDDVGQAVPGGRADEDIGGDGGAEQLVATLASPGRYRIIVESYGAEPADVEITAAWLPFPAVSVAPDPDGQPTSAMPLAPAIPVQDALDPASGDHWDWFSITLTSAGVLTIIVEAPEGDLVLEHFDASNFREPVTRTDEDMGGITGNESMTVSAEPGVTYYFRVSTAVTLSSESISYRIRVGVM